MTAIVRPRFLWTPNDAEFARQVAGISGYRLSSVHYNNRYFTIAVQMSLKPAIADALRHELLRPRTSEIVPAAPEAASLCCQFSKAAKAKSMEVTDRVEKNEARSSNYPDLCCLWRKWCYRHRTRKQLHALLRADPERLHHDLGLSTAAALSEIKKPFWRA